MYSPLNDKHFEGIAYRPAKDKFAVIFSDITERKRAEEALQSALEREKLLQRDIYHRTKNHLMQVNAFLSLQARLVRDPYDAELFRDVENRVHSMAVLNEFLYRSSDRQEVDFSIYAERLVKHMQDSYQINHIEFAVDIQDIWLDTNQALPCGLILTELVSNSIKHAFEKGQRGRVSIHMHRAEGCYKLAVSDNGKGFPSGADWRQASTLGTQLVLMLVRQIRGNIELEQSAETKFVVRFPVNGA